MTTPSESATADLTRRQLVAMMAASAGAFLVPRPASAALVRAAMHRNPEVASHAYTPKVYDAHEWATVQLLVNYVIPADAVSGSATDAAVPEFMDTMLDLEPTMRTANRGGLAWLDHECHARYQRDFVDCTDAQRRLLLDAIAYPARAVTELAPGSAWFSSFRDFTATGFFTSELGVKDLGYQGNTAVAEWTGCPTDAYTRLGTSAP